jgi:uncharacterized protein YegJ (DUF2314 family)
VSKIIYNHQNDEPMKVANMKAIRSFRYFCRELSWESRRIIPGLSSSAVKVPVKTDAAAGTAPEHEHMWFGQVDFDGVQVSGSLLNKPSWVSTMKPGDRQSFRLEAISDWMYAMQGRAYGGFTVDAMRAVMSGAEMRQHDAAWGLTFGTPGKVVVVPMEPGKAKGFLGLFKGKEGYQEGDDIPEHPMSLNMAEKCEQGVRANPQPFLEQNGDGSSMLHFDALAGNLTQVNILLKHGADKAMRDANGLRPVDLAATLKWDKVVAALS